LNPWGPRIKDMLAGIKSLLRSGNVDTFNRAISRGTSGQRQRTKVLEKGRAQWTSATQVLMADGAISWGIGTKSGGCEREQKKIVSPLCSGI